MTSWVHLHILIGYQRPIPVMMTRKDEEHPKLCDPFLQRPTKLSCKMQKYGMTLAVSTAVQQCHKKQTKSVNNIDANSKIKS